MTNIAAQTHRILIFWFGDPAAENSEYGQQRKIWFRKDPAFDHAVKDRFLDTYETVRQGNLTDWLATPQTALALTLLLDQFPRNMFRGTERCFETDSQALEVAQTALSKGFDQSLLPVERMFLYLPYEHSENLTHQATAIALFESLVQTDPELRSALDYAHRHRDVIARFGRFPHRNAALGRKSTSAEEAFLKQPGARF